MGGGDCGSKRQDSIPDLAEGQDPPEELLRGKTEQEQQHIKDNWVSIRHYSHGCRVQSTYNIRLAQSDDPDDSDQHMAPQLDAIFEAQPRAFKVNASAGVVLRNNATGDLRYWHASVNNARIFSEPYLVQSRQDFDEFVEALSAEDLTENALADADSSEWAVHEVTNVSIYANHLDFPIRANVNGAARRRGALDLTTDSNACFFYCLAAHRNQDKVNDKKKYRSFETETGNEGPLPPRLCVAARPVSGSHYE